MRKKAYAMCQSCGKKMEYTECSERSAPPGDARCNALRGWLSLSRWKGMGSFEDYDFCCISCLQKWVEAEVPKIPGTFFKAFQEE